MVASDVSRARFCDTRAGDLPNFFICSAKIGTVELTGLEMIATMAFGQFLETAVAKSRLRVAFTSKRSCRVIPGLRGTPAGITTTSHPADRGSLTVSVKSH